MDGIKNFIEVFKITLIIKIDGAALRISQDGFAPKISCPPGKGNWRNENLSSPGLKHFVFFGISLTTFLALDVKLQKPL